jgi:3-oxoacyl-[acyl-carrier protein] reductase
LKRLLTIKNEQGRLDGLVNNAGILVDTTITMLNSATLRKIFDVNVFAVFDLISYASRIMSKQKSGSIINISSILFFLSSYEFQGCCWRGQRHNRC